MLRYIVEQDLAGAAGRLKGASIAMDVFGKTAHDDPGNDTVVRVQAGRLRELLSQYYTGPGAREPLRVVIARGSYVPDYVIADEPASRPPPEAAAPPPPVSTPPQRSRLRIAAAASAVLLLAAAAYLGLGPPASERSAEASVAAPVSSGSGPDVTGTVNADSLPSIFADIGVFSEGGTLFANALQRGIAGFDSVGLIARKPVFGDRIAHRRTDYAFTLREESAAGTINLQLQNVVSGRVLMWQTIRVAGLGRQLIEDMVADILTSALPLTGIVFSDIAENRAQTDLVRCLALNDNYYRDQRPEAHQAAYECLQQLEGAPTGSVLVYAELASLHAQSIVNSYDYPPERSFETALTLARRAVQLGPGSPSAHRSMGYVLSRAGDPREAISWTRKAHELSPFDLTLAASYGYALVLAGAYREGTDILGRAVSAASAHPSWWDYWLFLGYFMNDEVQGAASAVSPLGASSLPQYLAARLLVADRLGNAAQAESLAREIRSEHAVFAADPGSFFERANYPAELRLKLVAALRGVGLGGDS